MMKQMENKNSKIQEEKEGDKIKTRRMFLRDYFCLKGIIISFTHFQVFKVFLLRFSSKNLFHVTPNECGTFL
jgi:hypothetical protein